MVELAFTLVPLLATMLAIMDFAMPIFLRSLFMNAVREGSRYGITYQTISGQSQTSSIQTLVQSYTAGFLSGTTGRNMIYVRYYSQNTLTEDTSANRNGNGNIIQVSIEGYQWHYMVPLMRTSTPLSVQAFSADRLETLPVGSTRPAP
jgi:Flp pilus assembly protein TadG